MAPPSPLKPPYRNQNRFFSEKVNKMQNVLKRKSLHKIFSDIFAVLSFKNLRDIFLKYCTFSIRTKVFVFHEKHMFETVEEEGNKGQRP